MNLLETIGALTVCAVGLIFAAVAWSILREMRRSLRQWCRVCRIICGKRWKSKARRDWRTFFKGWWLEFGEGYDSKEIRGIILPYDVRLPIRHRRFSRCW